LKWWTKACPLPEIRAFASLRLGVLCHESSIS
jgi:hypothetical protein